ncbi:6-aminohexanoate hydrolase [Vibrio breoganii]|uniref:serine hydrolase domain-containing protein n=1 Tax=Vibrio breoganii TaxID=553239 RepID=UPI000CA8C1A1|nr:serine hydrolase [Vibrio breoganii]PMO94154.1 6-aminohexanoate hydrolase [Vibrio breoganii]
MQKNIALSLTATLSTGAVMAQPSINETATPQEIQQIHDFFLEKGNKVKIQFPEPQSQYAWQNMSRFFPTAQITRDGQVYELPYALNKDIGMITAKVHGEAKTLNEHLDSFPVDGFLVVKKGEIVFERYNTMRKTDKHNWFSNAKITSGIELAKLVIEGKVNPQAPVSQYIPELKGSDWDSVTVYDTANMATGLNATEHDEPNHDSRTNPEQPWFKWAVSIGLFEGEGQQMPLESVAEMHRRGPGGEKFEYNSINTFVISRIVENVINKPMNEIVSQHMWQYMGANNDAFVAVSPHGGYPLQFFSMNSTLEDMAKYGMMLTPSAPKLAGHKGVGSDVIELIQTSGNPSAYHKGFAGQKFAHSFYDDTGLRNAFQFDAIFEDGDLFKSGVGGQGLYISPSKDLVIAFFSSGDGNNQEESYARQIAKSFN